VLVLLLTHHLEEPTVLHQDISKKHKHICCQQRTHQVVLEPAAPDIVLPQSHDAPLAHNTLHVHSIFNIAETNILNILTPAELAMIEAAIHQNPNLVLAPTSTNDETCLGNVLDKLSRHQDAENVEKRAKKQAATEIKMSHAVSVHFILLHTPTFTEHLHRTFWLFGSA
jgi:hypothetical protein